MTSTTSAYDTKSPIERGVRDLFKPPLEREYRDLITPASPDMCRSPHSPASASALSPASSSSHGTSHASSHVEPLSPAPPPYRDDNTVAFPEKIAPGQEAEQEPEAEGIERTDSPCDAIGHDLTLSKCQRRARVATFIMCPEVTAWLMLRKRTCKRCGEKVKPKDTIFHQ